MCRLVARHNDSTKTNGLEECRKAIENLGVRPMEPKTPGKGRLV